MSTACSEVSLTLGESLSATAPVAQAWLVLEVPGPWGRQAVRECALPEGLGDALIEASAGTGTTVLVARRPGRSDDEHAPTRRVWLAHTAPGGVRMRVAHLEDPRELLDVDLAALARGESPGLGDRTLEPTLFICSNAKRDACCAKWGGAVARTLADGPLSDRVWECSHLGGHRFAATALLLPFGTVHGRLDAPTAASLLTDADRGELVLPGYRGRTALPRWMQAAEIAVRESEGITGIDSLDVLRVADSGVLPREIGASPESEGERDCEVRCADGRAWRVRVSGAPRLPEREESCGGDAVAAMQWTVLSAERVEDWLSGD